MTYIQTQRCVERWAHTAKYLLITPSQQILCCKQKSLRCEEEHHKAKEEEDWGKQIIMTLSWWRQNVTPARQDFTVQSTVSDLDVTNEGTEK